MVYATSDKEMQLRMPKRKIKQYAIAGMLLLIFAATVGGDGGTKKDQQLANIMPPTTKVVIKKDGAKETWMRIMRVVDGDTFVVEIDGTEEKVRLIGIDTPEAVDPRKPVQCFGKEASNKAKEILSEAYVRLEPDPTQSDRDKYGRLLRYAFLENDTLFNEYMIKEGYAHEYTYLTPYRHQKRFKAAQTYARENKKGLWAGGVCGNNATDTIK